MGRFNWMLQALCALSVIISTAGYGTRAIAFTGTEGGVITKDNIIISDDPNTLGDCGISLENNNITEDLDMFLITMYDPLFLSPNWYLGEIKTYPDYMSITAADISNM